MLQNASHARWKRPHQVVTMRNIWDWMAAHNTHWFAIVSSFQFSYFPLFFHFPEIILMCLKVD